MAESLLIFEHAGQIVELTRDSIVMKVRPEVIERLRYLSKNDEVLRTSLESLIRWAHYPLIRIGSITDIHSEAVAAPPGSAETKRVVITAQYPGGFRTYEIVLRAADCDTLVAEIQKMLAPRF